MIDESNEKEIEELRLAEERWLEFFHKVHMDERRRLGCRTIDNPVTETPAWEAESIAWKKSGAYWREIELPKLKDNSVYQKKMDRLREMKDE